MFSWSGWFVYFGVIRNNSGIDLGYYEITDRLDMLFHLKVGAGVGSTVRTRLAVGRSL